MDYSLIPFIFVLIISTIVGLFFARSNQGHSEYFLGGRNLRWPLLTLTFVATQIGGGFILGTADSALTDGPFAIFVPLGYCLGFIALGLGFGAKLQGLNVNTTSDIFERYFGSALLKKLTALLSIISLTGILAAQAVALRKFLFTVGCDSELLFLAAWGAVILYTTQGGFLAVVWTDAIQAVVMIAMLIGAFYCTWQITPLPPIDSTQLTNYFDVVEPKIFGYLLMPFLFMLVEQDMAQRCFAAKSARDVTKAGLLSAVVLFILAAIPVYFGMTAQGLQVSDSTSAFMAVIKSKTGPFVMACAASSVLLAIISTASSLLSAVSSNLAQDFGNIQSIKRTKTITLITGLIALLGAYGASSIFSCMIASYEISVACLLVPILVAVYLKEKALPLLPAAYAAFIAGLAGFILKTLVSFGIYGDLIPLALSAVGFTIGMLVVRYGKRRETVTT